MVLELTMLADVTDGEGTLVGKLVDVTCLVGDWKLEAYRISLAAVVHLFVSTDRHIIVGLTTSITTIDRVLPNSMLVV